MGLKREASWYGGGWSSASMNSEEVHWVHVLPWNAVGGGKSFATDLVTAQNTQTGPLVYYYQRLTLIGFLTVNGWLAHLSLR